MSAFLSRPRRVVRQLAERVVLPATVALSGRRLGWMLARAASRWQRLYPIETRAMLAGHERLTGRPATPRMARHFRRQLVLEYAGCYRSRFAGPHRAARVITRVSGAWPRKGPFLAYGFHRAGGFAVLDHLASKGHAPVFLHTPPTSPTGVERWVARLESRQLQRLGKGELLTTGGSYERMRELVGRGRVVVALTDSPPAAGRSTLSCRVLGLDIRLRDGLFRLAAELAAPVALFYTRLEDDGCYSLVIRELSPTRDAEALGRAAAEMLADSLREDAAGWLYLNGLEVFLSPDSGPGDPEGGG